MLNLATSADIDTLRRLMSERSSVPSPAPTIIIQQQAPPQPLSSPVLTQTEVIAPPPKITRSIRAPKSDPVIIEEPKPLVMKPAEKPELMIEKAVAVPAAAAAYRPQPMATAPKIIPKATSAPPPVIKNVTIHFSPRYSKNLNRIGLTTGVDVVVPKYVLFAVLLSA
jgi:hypothetical protein